MEDKNKITNAERDVMEVLWKYSEPIQTSELLEQMKEKGRNWKRQTLNTLLFRLEEKDVVSRKRGYVQAALSEQELRQRQTEGILDSFYDGKLGNFCAALVGKVQLEEDEIAKLNALIDELKEE